jgi:hypothetical protein
MTLSNDWAIGFYSGIAFMGIFAIYLFTMLYLGGHLI